MKRRSLKQWQLEPSHSPVTARRRWEDSRDLLTTDDYDLLVEEDGVGVVDDETKFLFLRNVFPFAEGFYRDLSQLEFSESKRGSGQDSLFGYFYDARNGPPRLTVASLRNPAFYEGPLSALLAWTSLTVRRYTRRYWNGQCEAARRNRHCVVPQFPRAPRFNSTRGEIDYQLWQHSYRDYLAEFPLAPVFSTVTINRSVPFLPHLDARNKGGLACLMAFGGFSGGDLCLPRLRVAFRLRPGDLLVADNNNEYHGNVGAIWGDRISVVSYLRQLGQ